ncbi:hypothetical protein [Deinococcus aluminii]|uniref:Transposase n=1 Tax=Deinococcus aluminii TaxID=1656885 RepID=A0ABP9XH16_9DEIO
MHARVVTVQIRQGRGDIVGIFRAALVPARREQAGFCGARLLTDAAQMRVNEASGFFREQLARFAPVLSAPPSAERYEVSVSE